MQKLLLFIRKTGVAIVFVILEIVAIRCYAYSTPYTQARLLVWSNRVVGYVHSTFAGVSNYFTLRKENIRLTEHIATLENRIRTLEASVPEERVHVEGVLQRYEYLPAKVISSTTNRRRNFITLDKGFRDGVSADMAVMTPEGYAIGVVVDCSENFAVAKTLLNVDFRIGGVLAEDGSHGSVVWGGGDTQVIDFVELSKYAKVKEGDLVRAAGFSHYFPSEAVIGNIEKVELADNGTSYNCKVRLTADMGRLFNVVLVRNTGAGEAQSLEEKTYY
ncbi:MAG: rod shape-determining protein MreC [Alistipes sp.]|nr:rod shape-determining protein MreC [Alistipes sp.]